MLLIGGFAAGTHREKSKSDRNRCQGNLTARAAVEKAVPARVICCVLTRAFCPNEQIARRNTVCRDPQHVVTTDIL